MIGRLQSAERNAVISGVNSGAAAVAGAPAVGAPSTVGVPVAGSVGVSSSAGAGAGGERLPS
jgi:hypothetical protein